MKKDPFGNIVRINLWKNQDKVPMCTMGINWEKTEEHLTKALNHLMWVRHHASGTKLTMIVYEAVSAIAKVVKEINKEAQSDYNKYGYTRDRND